MLMEPWESAYEDYMAGMKYKDIASKHGVKLDTVKNWKRRKWGKPKAENKKVSKVSKVSGKKVSKVPNDTDTKAKPKKKPRGNSANGRNERNQFARVHGLYAKWLPEDIQEITGIVPADPLEIAWQNIQLQQAKIIKSFQVQHVKDKDDYTKRIISDGENGTIYQYSEAFDKDANFLGALSRAMGTLMNMLTAYDKMLHENWETASEIQKARLEKAKAEAAQIKAEIDQQEESGVEIVIDIPQPEWCKDENPDKNE